MQNQIILQFFHLLLSLNTNVVNLIFLVESTVGKSINMLQFQKVLFSNGFLTELACF